MGRLREFLGLSSLRATKDAEIAALWENHKLVFQAYRQEMAAATEQLKHMVESSKSAQELVERLRTELSATKAILQKQQSEFTDERSLLTSENEDLRVKVKDLKVAMKLQEEALAHATMQYNITLSQLRTDNTVLTSSIEREKSAREKLEVDVEGLRSPFSSTSSELEKSQAACSELEQNNHKEHEEWSRLLDHRDVKLNSLKETNENLSLKLSAAEAELSRLVLQSESKLQSLRETNHIMSLGVDSAEAKVSAFEDELRIANARVAALAIQEESLRKDLDDYKMHLTQMEEWGIQEYIHRAKKEKAAVLRKREKQRRRRENKKKSQEVATVADTI